MDSLGVNRDDGLPEADGTSGQDAARHAVLVVNTLSRKGRRLFADARKALAARGVVLDRAYSVRNPERLPEIVRDAVAQGHRFIIVGGGDGTVSSVVDHLAFKPATLGILPLGTANCFARTLSIPFDLADAIDTLASGKEVEVDLGRVGTDLFANAVAIGMPSIVNQGIPSGLKKAFGRLGYLIFGVWTLMRFKPFRVTIRSGSEAHSFDAVEVRVANGSYLGGLLVAEEASVESEDIVVQVVKGRSRMALIRCWLAEMRGRPSGGWIETIRGPELTVETEPSHPVSVDGEVLARTPIRCSVARQSLRVMVPRARADLD